MHLEKDICKHGGWHNNKQFLEARCCDENSTFSTDNTIACYWTQAKSVFTHFLPSQSTSLRFMLMLDSHLLSLSSDHSLRHFFIHILHISCLSYIFSPLLPLRLHHPSNTLPSTILNCSNNLSCLYTNIYTQALHFLTLT